MLDNMHGLDIDWSVRPAIASKNYIEKFFNNVMVLFFKNFDLEFFLTQKYALFLTASFYLFLFIF